MREGFFVWMKNSPHSRRLRGARRALQELNLLLSSNAELLKEAFPREGKFLGGRLKPLPLLSRSWPGPQGHSQWLYSYIK